MTDRFLYEQKTGRFLGPDNKLMAAGYSGHGPGVNNPAREAEKAVGPIPRGDWAIGAPYDSKNVGPYALPLTPVGHDAHGRTAFRIHGDKASPPRDASRGCIILSRAVREAIVKSGVKVLRVIEG